MWESDHGTAQTVRQPIWQNFRQILGREVNRFGGKIGLLTTLLIIPLKAAEVESVSALSLTQQYGAKVS